MAGLSRAVTEAIMETRQEYLGGGVDSGAPCQASEDQKEVSQASCLPPQQGQGSALRQRSQVIVDSSH